MKQINHPNILRLIEGSENGVLIKPDGSQKKVIYMVLELAPNKELFDVVNITGYIPERYARFYFK
jgi:hypothetical protein